MLEGSGISKIHLEVQGTEVYSTSCILANSVVSKLLEVETGGMAIFYLHFKTESIFDLSALLKRLRSINIQKGYTLHNTFGGERNKSTNKIRNEQEHQAKQQ